LKIIKNINSIFFHANHTKRVFVSVIAVIFQNTFSSEIYQNYIFFIF